MKKDFVKLSQNPAFWLLIIVLGLFTARIVQLVRAIPKKDGTESEKLTLKKLQGEVFDFAEYPVYTSKKAA
jgi:hypothetical protein